MNAKKIAHVYKILISMHSFTIYSIVFPYIYIYAVDLKNKHKKYHIEKHYPILSEPIEHVSSSFFKHIKSLNIQHFQSSSFLFFRNNNKKKNSYKMVLLEELENTLFGLVLKAGSGNQVEFKAERPVHISMVALDTKVPSSDHVRVMVASSEANKFLICTLSQSKVLQQQVTLELNMGESVTFSLDCEKGQVHMTGLYISQHAEPLDGHSPEGKVTKSVISRVELISGKFF